MTPIWRNGTGIPFGSSSRRTPASISNNPRSGSGGRNRGGRARARRPADDRLHLGRIRRVEAGQHPPSSSTTISLGTTLIFSPPRTIVALTVFLSIGSVVAARSPMSRSAMSVSRGFRRTHHGRLLARQLGRDPLETRARPASRALASASGRGRAGACRGARRSPWCTNAPWPPGPRTVAFSQQICFSTTWIG